VTGEDCFVLKVLAPSMRHLEATTGRIGGLGAVTTNVVYSSPLKSRPVTTAALGAADPGAGNATRPRSWRTQSTKRLPAR